MKKERDRAAKEVERLNAALNRSSGERTRTGKGGHLCSRQGKDRGSPESQMGKCAKGIEAERRYAEKANDVSRCLEEDRRGTESEMGQSESRKESCLVDKQQTLGLRCLGPEMSLDTFQ